MLQFFKALPGYLVYLWPGVLMTIQLTIISFAAGAFIGIIAALGRMRKKGIVFIIATIYVDFFRRTPLLVQLLAIYFLAGMYIKTSPFVAAIIGLSLNLGAYLAEAFRGVIESIHKGQWEAGRSLGMTNTLVLRRIILPQAIKILLPELTNYLIMVLLGSSLVSVVAVRDLTLLGQTLTSKTFRVEIYGVVALIYFIISYPLSKLSGWLENKWKIK